MNNGPLSRAASRRAKRAVEGSKRIPRRVRARLRQRLFTVTLAELEREQESSGRQE